MPLPSLQDTLPKSACLYFSNPVYSGCGFREGRGGAIIVNMPPRRSNPKTMHQAGELRLNQTPQEAKLWSELRAHRLGGIGFRRQHAIGTYIVDFCAPKEKLIIEVDGSQHIDLEEYDRERTAFLRSQGYRVIRFTNDDVRKDFETVLKKILLFAEAE